MKGSTKGAALRGSCSTKGATQKLSKFVKALKKQPNRLDIRQFFVLLNYCVLNMKESNYAMGVIIMFKC